MAWVAVGTVGASLAGSYLSGQAAKGAAQSQTDSANRANDIQLDMYNQNRQAQLPYQQAGYSALDMLMGRDQNFTKRSQLEDQLKYAQSEATRHQGLLDAGGMFGQRQTDVQNAFGQNQASIADYQKQLEGLGPAAQLSRSEVAQNIMGNDPGYQFRLDEGNKAITNSAAARGMGNSGRTMKELTRFGQQHASNEYSNAYNRLASIAGIGQTANAQAGQNNSNYANQTGQNYSNIGNAQAAGQIGQANAVNSGIGNAANIGMQYNYMDYLKNKVPAASPSSGGGQSYTPSTSGGYSLNF